MTVSDDKLATDQPIDRNALPTDQYDWGIIKWLVNPEQPGGAVMTMGEVVLLPGQGHSRHNHPDAEEILYVVYGSGVQMVDDDETFPIRPGDAIYIPQAVFHSTQNTGWEPMKLVAIYNPGGSEKGLRELPDFRQYAPGETPRFG